MAGSIKLFQFVQKCHQTLGILPRQPNPKQKQLSSHSIQAIFLTCLAQYIFTTAAFLLFKAKSMFDYGFSFFILIGLANCIAIYLIFIWQSENTLKFIENCEGFIEKSKFCWYEIFRFWVNWVIGCWPKFIGWE